MKLFILAFTGLFSTLILGVLFFKNVHLEQNCTGYLKRAADANTVETAKEQLQRAIYYLEENNITSGYTSILWKTPDEDIYFWYKNLKQSESELLKVDSTTSALEKANLLMKLRETLLDNGKEGDSLTYPDGLSRYPNNSMWGVLLTFALISVFVFVVTLGLSFD
jgi:hypothetical protein